MRIGIIGDTHIPALSPLPPARVGEVFKGLDIILHVGDICELYVLEQLQETHTLTFAVYGEDDSEEAKHYLDEKRVVRFGERRVGMIHGHQREEIQTGVAGGLRRLFKRRSEPVDLPTFLLGSFAGEEVDAIVFGHMHQPYVKMENGVLLFSPGAALPVRGQHPSVGILDIGELTITGRVVYL